MAQSTRSAVATVCVCLVWYALLSFTSQMTKFVLTKMSYPFLLAQIQFTVSVILSFCLIRLFRAMPEIQKAFPPGTVPSDMEAPLFRKDVLFKILPLGLLQSSGKYVSLCATQIVSVATIASIKALSPLLMVFGYRVFYNVKLPASTYFLLVPLLAGVIMIILADTPKSDLDAMAEAVSYIDSEHLKGILYSVVSVILMATQQIYGKELITWEKKANVDTLLHVIDSKIETSAPSTPSAQYLEVPSPASGKASNAQFWLILPKTIAKSFTHRPSLGHLPYSVSDLNLNELNPHAKTNPYALRVEEARSSTNPLARLSPATGPAKPDKLTVIFYISLIGFCISSGGFLTREAYGLVRSFTEPTHYKGSSESGADALTVVLVIFLISLCHFAQMLISFYLLGSIPALSYSIASMMKRIVIIMVSIVLVGTSPNVAHDRWFGRITSSQAIGLLLIGFGLYSYDRWGSVSTKRSLR